jgi:hypothetical protein
MPSLIALKKNGSIPNSSVIVAQSHHAPKKDERSCVDLVLLLSSTDEGQWT